MKHNVIHFAYFGNKTCTLGFKQNVQKHHPKWKHLGIITTAFEIREVKVEGKTIDRIKVAFSYCSPLDQFSKAKGRQEAFKRFCCEKKRNRLTGEHVLCAWIIDCSGDALKDIKDLFNNLPSLYTKPQWAQSWSLVSSDVTPSGVVFKS